jgi:two-component system KDP operon response regulator KdpE
MACSKESRILIVDDESSIRRTLRLVLVEPGFEVVEASRGEEAIHLLRAGSFDFVLLDINMPGIGGIATLCRLRTFQPRIPVLIVSVRDEEEEKITALELGASDFIAKPFSTRELVARIRSVLRRTKDTEPVEETARVIGEIHFVPARRCVMKAGLRVHLTPKEHDVLAFLVEHAGSVVTHREILSAVWGEEYREENDHLKAFVSQLRKKIEDDLSNPRYLITHAYVGYRFDLPPSVSHS